MGYLHIDNLYKNQEIFSFRECYALEKIHGSSTHISWKNKQINYFSGGVKHENFVKLFNEDVLKDRLKNYPDLTIFGEVYGGNCQKMADTYGKELSFVVFDVKINDSQLSISWFDVPQAKDLAEYLDLDFVFYTKINTNIDEINKERDRPSQQAKKKGIIEDKISEGVVLRPLTETNDSRGNRIIAKHKRIKFRERKTEPKNPADIKILEDAKEIAQEWVTLNRLGNILSHIPEYSIEDTGKIIKLMLEDIEREGRGEINFSHEVIKMIGKYTTMLYVNYLSDKITEYKKELT